MTAVVKLGGSLITDKAGEEAIDRTSLEEVARMIGEAPPADRIVVHGGGSFGHPTAARHGLSRTEGTRDPRAIADVTAAMRRLNDHVIDSFSKEGIDAVGVQPMGIARRLGNGVIQCEIAAIESLLAESFTPVIYGDLIVHEGTGCSVVSGDELTPAIGEAIGAERIGFCSGVPGVLDAEGNVIESLHPSDDTVNVGSAETTDVTGGMATKVRTLSSYQLPAAIFGREDLPAFLAGELPGTRIE